MSAHSSISKILSYGKLFVICYCVTVCTTFLLLLYIFCVLPLLVINRKLEKKIQEKLQSIWARLLLGVTGWAYNSKIFITLPSECGPEQESLVYSKLGKHFTFEDDDASLAKYHFEPPASINKRDIVISNHQLYLDWVYIWAMMSRMKLDGTVKIILKRSLMHIPIIGLGMKLFNFIFLHRNWQVDQLKFGRRLKRLVYGDAPFNLIIFPEGTTMCEGGKQKSEAFAIKYGLTKTDKVLLPRVTGIKFALDTIGKYLDGILDLTIGYSDCVTPFPENEFGLVSLYLNNQAPKQIHIHAKYHPVTNIPYENLEDFQKWLYDLYQGKDRLMNEFHEKGHFPGTVAKPFLVSQPSAIVVIWFLSGVSGIILWFVFGLFIKSFSNILYN